MNRNSQDQNDDSRQDSTTIITSKITRLQETKILYKRKIRSEKQKLHELEAKIEQKTNELKSKREELRKQRKHNQYERGDYITHPKDGLLDPMDMNDPQLLSTKVKALKIKINTQKTQLNQQIQKNQSFKDSINLLREEKQICDQVKYQLEQEVLRLEVDTKQNEDSLIKINKRKQEIESMKEENDKFQQQEQREKILQFQSNFKELNEKNRDQRLAEKKIKENFRKIKAKQEKRKAKMKSMGLNFYSKKLDSDSSDTSDDEFFNHDNYNRLDDIDDIPKNYHYENLPKSQKQKPQEATESDLKDLQQEVENYRNIFKQLKAETKCQNMDQIVDYFVELQDKNYALYTYINTLREEDKNLQHEQKKLKEVLQQVIEQNDPKHEKDAKTKKQKQLKMEIIKLEEKGNEYKQKHTEFDEIVQQLKISIPIMFDRIGCNSEEYLRELGGTAFNPRDIQESNMLQYLAIIERRTNELLQLYNVAYKSENTKNQKNGDTNQQSFAFPRSIPDIQSYGAFSNAMDQAQKDMQQLKEQIQTESNNQNPTKQFLQDNTKKKDNNEKFTYKQLMNDIQPSVKQKLQEINKTNTQIKKN